MTRKRSTSSAGCHARRSAPQSQCRLKCSAQTKVRIAILGPMDGQAGVIASRCGRRARLSFVNRDRGDKCFPSCDHLILWTKFIQHRWTEAAYRQFPRDRVHLHDGGLTGLVEKINELAAVSQ